MIDLMFTLEPEVLKSEGVALTDHGFIYSILAISVQKQRQCLWLVRCLRKCDVEALLSDLDMTPWSAMDTFQDIDSRWEYWKSLFVASHNPYEKGQSEREDNPLDWK